MENGFTMLDYEEYFYLINPITKTNADKGRTPKSNKCNAFFIQFSYSLPVNVPKFRIASISAPKPIFTHKV